MGKRDLKYSCGRISNRSLRLDREFETVYDAAHSISAGRTLQMEEAKGLSDRSRLTIAKGSDQHVQIDRADLV